MLPAPFPLPAKAKDYLRIGANHDAAMIGVNMRWQWQSAQSGAGNPLMRCTASTRECQTAKIFASSEVAHVQAEHQGVWTAEIEQYAADNLDSRWSTFASSADQGTTWSPVPLPVSCTGPVSCSLHPESGTHYFLLASTYHQDAKPDFTTQVLETQDGGKSWVDALPHTRLNVGQSLVHVAGRTIIYVEGEHPALIHAIVLPYAPERDSVVATLPPDGRILQSIQDDGRTGYLLHVPDNETEPGTLFAVKRDAISAIRKQPGLIARFRATPGLLLIDTVDKTDIAKSAADFRHTLHTSTDHGATWRDYVLPDALSNSVYTVVGGRIWLATPTAVYYLDPN
ncbi:hypothetical protein GCM10010971_37740 [Silvimonas amylolytica]|uniref:BNR repeat-like domain-containing protein n=1 Tax=Silvimonas amylolytica TaxID=449663 RepID=A0ABQ2PR78_9NEIS|nr:hypothetical protein GCM10010971_37740 [Silvimonas amylolytica]